MSFAVEGSGATNGTTFLVKTGFLSLVTKRTSCSLKLPTTPSHEPRYLPLPGRDK